MIPCSLRAPRTPFRMLFCRTVCLYVYSSLDTIPFIQLVRYSKKKKTPSFQWNCSNLGTNLLHCAESFLVLEHLMFRHSPNLIHSGWNGLAEGGKKKRETLKICASQSLLVYPTLYLSGLLRLARQCRSVELAMSKPAGAHGCALHLQCTRLSTIEGNAKNYFHIVYFHHFCVSAVFSHCDYLNTRNLPHNVRVP